MNYEELNEKDRVMQTCIIAALARRLGYEIFMNLDKAQGYLEIFFDEEVQKDNLWVFLGCFSDFCNSIEWFDKEIEYDGYTEKPHCLIDIY